MERIKFLPIEFSYYNFKKCIKEILYYSDTELLDLTLILLLILVNPFIYSINPDVSLFWKSISIISGFTLLSGLLTNKPYIKQWGYKLGTIFFTAIFINCFIQNCWYVYVSIFSIQLVIILYLLWRNDNQHI
jgi:hypothetical protein